MMTVHKVAGEDVVGYSAYLTSSGANVSRRGDYYLGLDGFQTEGIGQWHGAAAAELGLTGEVTRDQLLRVWEGKDPETAEILVRRSAQHEHVAAVDCTFSAPKSVSITWALADPAHRADLEDAQSRAVAVALSHIEGQAPLVRRRIDGAIRHEQTAGLVVARFRHHTSRVCTDHSHDHGHGAGAGADAETGTATTAKGRTPDPQLHDHCAIANLALRKPDALAKNGDRWAAVDSRELYRVAAEAGAVYRAELAADLQRMGYRIHREGRYFEINGVSEQTRRVFSQRAQEVEAATAQFISKNGRRPTDEEARNLVVLSRSPKTTEDLPRDAFSQWQERAAREGLTPADVHALRQGAGRESSYAPLSPAAAAALVIKELADPESAHAITKSAAVFDERTLRIAVAEAAQGRVRGADVPALITAVAASPEFVALDATKAHYTTQRMLDTERAVLLTARVRALSSHGMAARPSAINEAIRSARVPLTDEQQAAVRALSDGRAMALINAEAGTGKGEVLRAVTQAYRENGDGEGRRVIALAAAGETAQRLKAETGADEARTIDSFIFQAKSDHPPEIAGAILIVDEAGLLETTRWHALLAHTENSGAKVIAAGDGAQLSPIEAGGLWPVLEQRIGAAHLSENFRAQEDWARDAWTALREGQSATALRAFEERQQIIIADDRIAARTAAVERWDQERQDKQLDRVLLLTDSSNVDVDALNAAAQQRRLEAGELGASGLQGGDIASRGADSIEVQFAYPDGRAVRREELHQGDVVTFERRVYPEARDQERQRRGDIPTTRRIENGEPGTITKIDSERQRIEVQLRDRQVVIEQEQLSALRLGYAQHVYSAQGRTVDTAIVLTGGWQTDRENSYVGISRARENTVVVTDFSSLGVKPGAENRAAAITELSERFAQSRSKVAAVSLADRDRAQREGNAQARNLEPIGAERVAAKTARAEVLRSSGLSRSPTQSENSGQTKLAPEELTAQERINRLRNRANDLSPDSARDTTTARNRNRDDDQERRDRLRRDHEYARQREADRLRHRGPSHGRDR